MSPRKALLSLGALALASAAVTSVPAMADDPNDDTLWLVAWGAAGAAIVTLILTQEPHAKQPIQPISP